MSGLLDGVERIAVLRANALGDLLLTLPALEALKRAYPQATLTLLGRDWHAEFLDGRPGPVDDVVALPDISAPIPDSVYEDLRKREFDLALQMHGGGRESNPFIRNIGAGFTAGLRTPDAEPLDRWLPYVHYQHETLRFLEVAGLVGAEPCGDLEPRVTVTEQDRAELDRVVGPLPRGLVAVHPGASDKRRRWPPKWFAAVAGELGRPVVVTGIEEEREVVERVVAALDGAARPVIGALSIGGLAALYASCDLLISNDTGPRHLAAAVGTPNVAIFWCGNLVNAGPLSRARNRPLVSWTTHCPRCGREGTRLGMRDCGHQGSWVVDVPVDDVLAQARDLLT